MRVTFTETWIDMPDGYHGPSIRYRAGCGYELAPDVAERAVASGRAQPDNDLPDRGPAAGSPDDNEEITT